MRNRHVKGIMRILTEREVQGLGREVPDDVRGISSPEGEEALIAVCAGKAVDNALVWGGKTTLLDLQGTVRHGSAPGTRARTRLTISS